MDDESDPFEPAHALERALQRLEHAQATGDLASLLYCALDVRLCIERQLFVYLVLIKSAEIPAKLERLYSATDLRKAILTEEPNFYKKIEFFAIFMEFLPYPGPVVVPDLDVLSDGYGRLNNYLHAPKRPSRTSRDAKWWAELEACLKSTMAHLRDILSAPTGNIELNDQGSILFQAFLSGEKTADEVRTLLKDNFKTSPMRRV